MRVAITGHTKGLGLELSKLFEKTVGMSRSNGFDIKNTEKIVEHCAYCDVFINNACVDYAQLDLLYAMYNKWQYKSNKTIVTIGSMASNAAEWRLEPCKYSTIKHSLDVATRQLINSHNRKCKLMIFKPSYLGDKGIPYNVAAEKLYQAILNNDYETTEITLRF